jgi:intracellular septation protein A
MKASNILAATSILATISAIASLILINEVAFLMLFTCSIITLFGALSLNRENL